ncbi:MAG: signal peptidase II [Clostridiales bacterium]|nr:MAG: signal peptidase II [Clostridiales bacterium]
MLYAIVVFLGVMADQLTKLWVSGSLMGEGVVRVIPGIINFRYVENTGMAFSMMSDMTLVLTVASGVLTVVMGVLLWKLKSRGRFLCISLSLIMAGAIGNLIDRIFAGFVVDFIEFAFVNFAVFNVADICVCVGTAMLVIYILFSADRKKEEKKSGQSELDTAGDGGAGSSGESTVEGQQGKAETGEGRGEADAGAAEAADQTAEAGE